MNLLLIGMGGFAGAIARYLIDGWVSDAAGGSFPYGTLAVNVSGSFLLGVLFAATTERAILSPELRGPVMIGFIGAYTTFSTLMLETWRLGESAGLAPALANVVGSGLLGLVAVGAGLAVGRMV